MMRRKICFLSLLLVSLAVAQVRADAVGDTYSIGLTAFNNTSGAGAFVVAPTTLTFDITTKTIGPSAFGNVGDTMQVAEGFTDLGGGLQEITIDVFALDSNGALTNWFADGTLLGGTDVVDLVFLDLADFNGGADKLDPLFTPFGSAPGANSWEVVSAEFFFIGTGGGLFGPGGLPFSFFDTSDATGLSGSAGVNYGADVSTATFGGEEFAGYAVTLTIQAIPEPSSLGLLGMGLNRICLRRRSR